MDQYLVFFVASALLGILLNTRGCQAQIKDEDVPDELQYLLTWDLDTWEAPKEIAKNYIYYLSGFDYEDRPIWVLEFGKWDIRAALERGKEWEDALSHHVDQWLWRMYNSSGMRSTPENRVSEIEVIIDMDGYNIRQISAPQAMAFIVQKLRLIAIAMKFAHAAYAVNTNFVAQNLITIVRPILGKEFEKVEIFGTNKKKWIPAVLRHIPKDQIPEWYGGIPDFKPVQVFG